MSKNWSRLSSQQRGKYAEYFAKMEFTRTGFDVYTAEVDDKGIDLVVRVNQNQYLDVQVKSLCKSNYAFMRQEVFTPRKNLYLVLILFSDGEDPKAMLIPSTAWQTGEHSELVYYDYQEKKSKPEFGIRLGRKSREELLEAFRFEKMINSL